MTDDDVKGNLLVWDESDLGCGKGKLSATQEGMLEQANE